MYKLTYAKDICGKKAICRAGYPENVVPDLCFYNTMSPSNYTEINSYVLIDALLSSKCILDELGLVVLTKDECKKLTQVDIEEPPLISEEEKVPAPEEVPASDAVAATTEQEPTPLPKRIFTPEEKKVLNKVTKEYAEEHGCSLNVAKEYIAQHLDEYLPKEASNG